MGPGIPSCVSVDPVHTVMIHKQTDKFKCPLWIFESMLSQPLPAPGLARGRIFRISHGTGREFVTAEWDIPKGERLGE